MLVSSILNSVTFKNLAGNTYPHMWNTLHINRMQGTNTVKPYWQKFPKDHVLYLQFSSNINDDIVLTSYCGTTQIDIFTVKWDDSGTTGSHYGTTDNRYFTNFVVTLDSDYYDKKVYFTATQGTDILTSEPVYVYDLMPELAKGTLKYIKYTNLDRNESDLDDRFIDWSILQSTGKYMDIFVDAIDIDPNDSDKNEVLEGSQSMVLIAASYHSGRVLKTGGVPDYMATRLGVASSLDVFTVNGLQYIKSEEISQERYGSSTLYQVAIRLTQKITIGINVDNTEPSGPVLISATIKNTNPAWIFLIFDILLDISVVPDYTAFLIKVNGNPVDCYPIFDDFDNFFLSNDIGNFSYSDIVTISYTKPETNPLKGINGIEVDNFTTPVTNNIAAPAESVVPTSEDWADDETDTRTFIVTTDLDRWYFGSGSSYGDFTVDVYDSTNTTLVEDGIYESGMVVRVTPLAINQGNENNVCTLNIANASNETLCTYVGTQLAVVSDLTINHSSCRFYQDGTPLDYNSFTVTHTDTYFVEWEDGSYFAFDYTGDAFTVTPLGTNTSGVNYTDRLIITQGALNVYFDVIQYYLPGIIT
jgi:hypothetical protein